MKFNEEHTGCLAKFLIEKGIAWSFFLRTKLIMSSKRTIIDIVEIIRGVFYLRNLFNLSGFVSEIICL